MSEIKAIIQTCTGNLEESKSFYKKLKFRLLSKQNPTLFTDGKMLLEINPVSTARIGLKLYKEDWSEVTKLLERITSVVELENGFLISDPNGIKVYLINGKGLQGVELKGESMALPGNFVGLSIEAVDIKRTISFWQLLGYRQTMGSIEQGWIAFDNGSKVGISIMKPMVCPHLFFNPGLTYFNGGKNLPIIQKIRAAGIPIKEEITVFNKEGVVDNIIISDPGGLGFFIFND